MKVYVGSGLTGEGGRFRDVSAVAGAALVAAVVPVLAVVALAVSRVARRALAAKFVASGQVPGVARGLAFGWIAGFVLVMVGQAAGAAAGPMSMLDPVGLVAHTLFGLCGEAVISAATILVLRRDRAGLSAPG
jgi:hypothetical protein